MIDLTQINAAIESARANPSQQWPHAINGDPMQTIEVQQLGQAFRVVARIAIGPLRFTKSRNVGNLPKFPELDWPPDMQAQIASHIKACVDQAEEWILKNYRQITISNGQLQLTIRDPQTLPKTRAALQWIMTCKELALAGQNKFPPAPVTEIELLSE